MEELPEIRVGTAEREQAMRRLSDHFAAGRLSVAEFDERSGAIATALTRGDLDKVFADLPSEPTTVLARPAPPASRFLAEWPDRLIAAIPIIAVILFFVTGSSLWFLAIPLAAVLFGTRQHQRDEDRDEKDRS